MPHARAWTAAEIRSLAPDEHEEAVTRLREAEQLGEELEHLGRRNDTMQLDLGAIFAEALDKDWARAVKGMTTEEWAGRHFRNRDGEPMGISNVYFLASAWRAISQFPVVENLLRKGGAKGERATTLTAAYYACETALVAEWGRAAVEEFLNGKSVNDLTIQAARDHAEKTVNERLLSVLARRSSREIRNDFYAMKAELRIQGDSARKLDWTTVSGSVVRSVKEQFDSVAERVRKLNGEDLPVEEMTLTQEIERVAGFGIDVLDALEAGAAGNMKPIQSLIALFREGS